MFDPTADILSDAPLNTATNLSTWAFPNVFIAETNESTPFVLMPAVLFMKLTILSAALAELDIAPESIPETASEWQSYRISERPPFR